MIDRWCNRHFFARRATLRFDGSGGATLGVPDLVSVDGDGVRIYERGYGGFPTVWEAGDYRLLPENADPAAAMGVRAHIRGCWRRARRAGGCTFRRGAGMWK